MMSLCKDTVSPLEMNVNKNLSNINKILFLINKHMHFIETVYMISMQAWLHGTLLRGNKNGILCRFASENAVLDIGDLL